MPAAVGQTPTGLPQAARPTMPPPAAGAPPAGLPPVAVPGKPGPATPPPPKNPPTASAGGAAGKSPIAAGPKKSILRFLPFVVIALLIIGVVGFLAMRFLNGGSNTPSTSGTKTPNQGGAAASAKPTNKQVTLTYWGLWEPSEVMTQVLKDFETANPGITVQYVKQSPKDYRERLQTAIVSGNGPDLFRFHASWVPMLKAELSPMPGSVMSSAEYQKTFYPVAAKQLQLNGQFVGIPLMYDGLALYYNKDVLQTAGVEPPTTWSGLRTLATQLTVRTSGGSIERAGLAIGTASNVDHFSDIIGLLMLQNGADLTNPTTVEARDALTFYTNFAKVDKVWDSTLPNSTTAFARGDVAMMFAPTWRVHEIKAMNPNLNFGIAPLPKLAETQLAWASYWAEGVSAQSKNKDDSWKLLKYLSSPEIMQKLYSSQSQVRSFGEPYSRVDLATQLADDPYVAPYLSDAPAAQGWYLSSNTFDNGINDQIIKYYEDAITAVAVNSRTVSDVVTTLDQGVKQVLRQFGVPVTSTGSTTTGGTTGR